MKIPEIQERLRELSLELGILELDGLADELSPSPSNIVTPNHEEQSYSRLSPLDFTYPPLRHPISLCKALESVRTRVRFDTYTKDSLNDLGSWMVNTLPVLVNGQGVGFCTLEIVDDLYVEVRIVTGGWSGIEELIGALESLHVKMFYSYSWQRGGVHTYRVPLSQIGDQGLADLHFNGLLTREEYLPLMQNLKTDEVE